MIPVPSSSASHSVDSSSNHLDVRPAGQVARDRIALAYSPALAGEVLRHLGDRFAEHLAASQEASGPVLPWRAPTDNLRDAAAWMTTGTSSPCLTAEEAALRFRQLVDTILARGINLHHRNYVGHQVAPPPPLASVFDAVSSLTNQGAAVYEMGPWSTAVEAALVTEMGRMFGLPPGGFTGFATHGGSLGNLTALLTARNLRFPESWKRGFHDSVPPVVLVHGDAHYCISRAAGILGLGTERVVRLPLDAQRRIDPAALQCILRDHRENGIPVLAVVACAGTTLTGAFDPLPALADLCREYGVWLHVDAAHGGAAAFSPRFRHLVDGLERADSFLCDAHKMMFAPALCAFVFHRHPEHRFATFAQEAPYLYDPSAPGMADFDYGLLTLECTKRAMTYTIWGLWSLLGPQVFADLVEQTFDLAADWAGRIRDAGDFELLADPQCNIVVFRYSPAEVAGWPAERVGLLNREIRRKIMESGEFYFVQTSIDGVGAMRAVVMNPLTRAEDLRRLLDRIRETARELLMRPS